MPLKDQSTFVHNHSVITQVEKVAADDGKHEGRSNTGSCTMAVVSNQSLRYIQTMGEIV